jgi:hypothetical protein
MMKTFAADAVFMFFLVFLFSLISSDLSGQCSHLTLLSFWFSVAYVVLRLLVLRWLFCLLLRFCFLVLLCRSNQNWVYEPMTPPKSRYQNCIGPVYVLSHTYALSGTNIPVTSIERTIGNQGSIGYS